MMKARAGGFRSRSTGSAPGRSKASKIRWESAAGNCISGSSTRAVFMVMIGHEGGSDGLDERYAHQGIARHKPLKAGDAADILLIGELLPGSSPPQPKSGTAAEVARSALLLGTARGVAHGPVRHRGLAVERLVPRFRPDLSGLTVASKKRQYAVGFRHARSSFR